MGKGLHELDPGPHCPEVVRMIVEIPKNSSNKYEYDRELGVFRLDRVLYSPMHYPGDYGFIPGTFAPDGDPLDALVLVDEASYPGVMITVRPVGLLDMVDQQESDQKVLCVPFDNPRFDQIHTIDQVMPHTLREIAADRVRRARAAYFGMITEVDRMVGNLIDELEKTGQMERTLIVYTSDHGEMLGENGLWFKNVLLENAARVPLIMAGAGLPRGRTVDTPVMHVDMVATMLELAGLTHDSKLRGHSLTDLAHSRPGAHPGIAYSESHSEGNCTGSFMIRKANWKYIYATGYEPILFDLQGDPRELQNLAGTRDTAAIQQELHAELLRLIPDPDAVTETAFAVQQALLDKMIRSHTRQELYEELRSRLGNGQARILANQLYRERKDRPGAF